MTDGSGEVTLWLASTVAEEKTLTATIDGTFTLELSVSFLPDVPSAKVSTLEIEKEPRVADGEDATPVVVIVRDARGNPVPAVTVSLTAEGDAHVFTPESGSTDEEGVFSATVASTRPVRFKSPRTSKGSS